MLSLLWQGLCAKNLYLIRRSSCFKNEKIITIVELLTWSLYDLSMFNLAASAQYGMWRFQRSYRFRSYILIFTSRLIYRILLIRKAIDSAQICRRLPLRHIYYLFWINTIILTSKMTSQTTDSFWNWILPTLITKLGSIGRSFMFDQIFFWA